MALAMDAIGRLQRVADYAITKVGCGYIMGATGWVCSAARRQQQAAQYPASAEKILSIGAKWDGVQCFDCAQLTRFAVQAAGGKLPSGATSQWQRGPWQDKGTMDTMPDVPGVLLYRQDGGVMQHTGVYIGGGEAVDARGTADGVIRRARGSYAWTHWAVPLLAAGGGEAVEPGVPSGADGDVDGSTDDRDAGEDVIAWGVVTASSVNLRREPGGEYLMRVPQGTRLPIYQIYEPDDVNVLYGRTETINKHGTHTGWVALTFVALEDVAAEPGDGGAPGDGSTAGYELVITAFGGRPLTSAQVSGLMSELGRSGYEMRIVPLEGVG